MPGGEIDDTSAAKDAADATRRLPRFVEFLAREAARMTHRAGEAIEQGRTRKPRQIAIGKAPLR